MTESNWPFELIEPIGSGIEFVADEMKIGGLTKRAFSTLELAGPLLALARSTFNRTHNKGAAKAVGQLLSEQPFNEDWAKQERSGGYPTLNRHIIVAAWSGLEVALEDTFVLVLMNDPDAFAELRAAGINPPKGVAYPPSEAEARKCHTRALGHDRSATFSDRVVDVFALIGLSVGVEDTIARRTDEINAVRNALLHRGGLIDAYAVKQSPGLASYEGQLFKPDEKYTMQALDAISEFMQALLVGVTEYVKRAARAT